jgi:hypothetical protein
MKENKGRMGEGMRRGKGKGEGGEQRGEGLLGRVEGKEDGMYCFVNCSSSDDHFLQKNISSQGRGGSQGTGTC